MREKKVFNWSLRRFVESSDRKNFGIDRQQLLLDTHILKETHSARLSCSRKKGYCTHTTHTWRISTMASISSTHINLAESDRVCLGAHSNKEFVIHAVSKTHTMHYTVSPETRLQAVMDDFCMSSSVLPMSVEFMFNGKNVTGDDSIASLTIEPDDCIDVVSVEATFPTTPGKKTTPTSQSSTKRKIPMKHFMQSPISVQARCREFFFHYCCRCGCCFFCSRYVL